MLYDILRFLCDEVNKYLTLKMGVAPEPRLKLGNISLALEGNVLTGPNSLSDRAVLTLVNIEEDKVAKQQENYTRTDSAAVYKSPPLYVNLYILFSINKPDYEDCLKILGHIMQFFQHQNVFTPMTHPGLNGNVSRLIVDLFSLNFEQVNHLWSTLGGKYMPSAMYKIRQVTINEDLTESESGFIKEVEIGSKLKLPVT
jgi:hypothetical protein